MLELSKHNRNIRLQISDFTSVDMHHTKTIGRVVRNSTFQINLPSAEIQYDSDDLQIKAEIKCYCKGKKKCVGYIILMMMMKT